MNNCVAESYVYLMREINYNLVKIGYSNSPHDRKHSLYNEKQWVLKVISFKKFETPETARSVESFLHKRYAKRRVIGELFSLTQTELEEIMSYFAQSDMNDPPNILAQIQKLNIIIGHAGGN